MVKTKVTGIDKMEVLFKTGSHIKCNPVDEKNVRLRTWTDHLLDFGLYKWQNDFIEMILFKEERRTHMDKYNAYLDDIQAYHALTYNPKTVKILDLWESKINDTLISTRDSVISRLKENDVLNQRRASLANDMIEIIINLIPETAEITKKHRKAYIKRIMDCYPIELPTFTSETTDKITSEEEICEAMIKENSEKCVEIRTMLSACDTYEQEIVVLKNYGVVDENGKLNVSTV